MLGPWIISHFPEHKTYTEAFGGGCSVLLRKPRSFAEVYNDLDGEVVNVFRVLRDQGCELQEKLFLTPFSREEFLISYEPSEDPVEQARRTITRSLMGFGSDAITRTILGKKNARQSGMRVKGGSSTAMKTGFRANSNRSGTTPAGDWKNYPDAIPSFVERLRGVVIENRDAMEVILQHDAETTLHYVDPPYVHETRYLKNKSGSYRHEMTNQDHIDMLRKLRTLAGMVVISGYEHDVYSQEIGDWTKVIRATHADGSKGRIEALWLSPNVPLKQPELFV
jgi:DNA adenine methylase